MEGTPTTARVTVEAQVNPPVTSENIGALTPTADESLSATEPTVEAVMGELVGDVVGDRSTEVMATVTKSVDIEKKSCGDGETSRKVIEDVKMETEEITGDSGTPVAGNEGSAEVVEQTEISNGETSTTESPSDTAGGEKAGGNKRSSSDVGKDEEGDTSAAMNVAEGQSETKKPRLSEDMQKNCKVASPKDDVVVPQKDGSDEILNPSVVSSEANNPDPTAHLLTLRGWHGVTLDIIPQKLPELPRLNSTEFAELQKELQIVPGSAEDGWRDDWHSNLLLFDREVVINREEMLKNPRIKEVKVAFSEIEEEQKCFRNICLLLFHVYHLPDTPPMARRVLAHSFIRNSAQSYEERLLNIFEAIRRVSYDPLCLHQNGWTVLKSPTPENPAGGSHLIGRKIIWDKFEAVIVAFVKDEHLGDLWKARWLEDDVTFDLEAEEVLQAIKKFEKKQAKHKAIKEQKGGGGPSSGRSALGGIHTGFGQSGLPGAGEHGIVLATSCANGARHGVMWPARIMSAGEAEDMGIGRKTTKKSMVHVVFLAPYWGSSLAASSGRGGRKAPVVGLSDRDEKSFNSEELFAVETVDANAETMQPYPHQEVDVKVLRASFNFFGLPNAAFPRYVEAHRLACGLRRYALDVIMKKKRTKEEEAVTAAVECHFLSKIVPAYPREVLNMSFFYILSSMPKFDGLVVAKAGREDETKEPCIDINGILESMAYPNCIIGGGCKKDGNGAFQKENGKGAVVATSESNSDVTASSQPPAQNGTGTIRQTAWKLKDFLPDDLARILILDPQNSNPLINSLNGMLKNLIRCVDEITSVGARDKIQEVLYQCLVCKSQGESILISALASSTESTIAAASRSWRGTAEKIFDRTVTRFSTDTFGRGITATLSDSNCNRHITASNSFERAVRLPAAIRAAKKAGAGGPGMPLSMSAEQKYWALAEKMLPECHSTSYIKRIRSKIVALPQDARGVALTDDSDGEGGEDTMGSPGSYDAAIASVACALKGVDMILGGDVSNAFCAVRPPGHHAGRTLHPMGATSNGFCLLNAAAIAALYAVKPVQDGGRGLARVAVLDFDVHHGNGTQDILGSTYDPRFLYISVHAGGSDVNGSEETDADQFLAGHLGYGRGREESGIFPGRCGDTSPHPGVLNLPLGEKVTPLALGHAMTVQVNDAILKFDPDLIILSSGFDAHINDPLGLGMLSAKDFANITLLACQIAARCCSGRILSLLEGGYGVPCCRIPEKTDLFLPSGISSVPLAESKEKEKQYLPIDLGSDLPSDMDDDVPYALISRLDKCHPEGFLDCVREHVSALHQSSKAL